MARQARLLAPGLPHLVQWRSVAGTPTCHDSDDQAQLIRALGQGVAETGLLLHAYTLTPNQVLLLATPHEHAHLSQCVQSMGRRYVSAYNRKHNRHGALWSGRFRSTALDPAAWLMHAQVWIDSLAIDHWASSKHSRLGLPTTALNIMSLIQIQPYWMLGNTPFEREATYTRMLQDGLPAALSLRLEAALRGGWPLGTFMPQHPFAPGLEVLSAPRRPRGRPPKAPSTH